MKNNIDKLRDVLFRTIDKVEKGDLPNEDARVINELCQTVINSAKVEVDYIKQNNGVSTTQFMIGRKENLIEGEAVEQEELRQEDENTAEIKSLLSQPKIPQGDKSASYVHIGGAGQRAMRHGS